MNAVSGIQHCRGILKTLRPLHCSYQLRSFALMRYSEGATPVHFLNALLKAFAPLKPVRAAISSSGRLEFFRNSNAVAILHSVLSALKEIPAFSKRRCNVGTLQ